MSKKCKCGICDKEFKSHSARLRHKKEVHGGYFNSENKGGGQMEEENKEQVKVKRKSPIQKVAKILVPEEQAKIEWRKYCQLLKTRKDKHLKVLKDSMYWSKKGKQLIDVYEVMKKAGLNKNNEPRLAIVRADFHDCFFEKRDTGTGIFSGAISKWDRNSVDWNKDNVILPEKTFSSINWERSLRADGTPDWNIKNKLIKTKVPIIPVDLMPEGDLSHYYVLWEVKEWELLPEIKDPFLLKRISENLFVILGAWEITALERAIMGGLK